MCIRCYVARTVVYGIPRICVHTAAQQYECFFVFSLCPANERTWLDLCFRFSDIPDLRRFLLSQTLVKLDSVLCELYVTNTEIATTKHPGLLSYEIRICYRCVLRRVAVQFYYYGRW